MYRWVVRPHVGRWPEVSMLWYLSAGWQADTFRCLAPLPPRLCAQNRAMARHSSQAEAEIRALKNKLKEAQDGNRVALAAATDAAERASRERNALANALALLSQQAVSRYLVTHFCFSSHAGFQSSQVT